VVRNATNLEGITIKRRSGKPSMYKEVTAEEILINRYKPTAAYMTSNIIEPIGII